MHPNSRARTLTCMLAATCLSWAELAAAQTVLPRDTSVAGVLTDDDPRLPDGNPYDEFVISGNPGERVRLQLRSTAFDSFLLWGTRDDSTFTPISGNDEGSGGSDADLAVALVEGGRYVVRVTSFTPNGRGAYSLLAQTLPSDSAANASAVGIRSGERVRGTLESIGGDTAMSPRDAYVYHARPGEAVTFALSSTEFTPILRVSTVESGLASILEERRAVAGEARVRLVFDRAETLLVEAAAPAGTAVDGDYTLRLSAQQATALDVPRSPVVAMLGKISILQRPVPYRVGTTSDRVEVPAGFVTDRASIPYLVQWLIPKDGLHTIPAIVHDYLYWTGTCTKSQADRLFMHAMADTRTPAWQRNMIYKAVDLFGFKAFSDNARDRAAGALRVLPEASRVPPANMNWLQYAAYLEREGVAAAPNLPVPPAFCRRGEQLRPPGVPY